MKKIENFLSQFEVVHRHQPEFVQAVKEVLLTIGEAFESHPHYLTIKSYIVLRWWIGLSCLK